MIIKNIRKKSGFTLIELMITVAIVGILAALALPAYQDYTIRSQVSEGFQLAGALQAAEQEYYANNGSFADLTTLGVNSPTGKYVSNIDVVSTVTGELVISYGGPSANSNITNAAQVTLTPVDANGTGNIHWSCDIQGTMQRKWVPSSCTADSSGTSTLPSLPNVGPLL
jgi:type IV pilus assembly protein PilA